MHQKFDTRKMKKKKQSWISILKMKNKFTISFCFDKICALQFLAPLSKLIVYHDHDISTECGIKWALLGHSTCTCS